MLKTIAFRNGRGVISGSMSFYGTHPQVANGRKMYSADAPGEALHIMTANRKSLSPAYFTGADGNVNAAKYSSATDLEGNLLKFGKILTDGMVRSLANLRWTPAESFSWKLISFPFPHQPLAREELLREINRAQTPNGQKRRLAFILSCFDYHANRQYPVYHLKIGPVNCFFLAGEPFVQYQFFLQSLFSEELVAVAGNCRTNFLYLPLAESFDEGGYELTYCWCSADFEKAFKGTLSRYIWEEKTLAKQESNQ